MQRAVAVLVFSAAVLTFAREAKWFLPRATVTRLVYEQHVETQVVPSSCAVVEPSLKPCRHLRQLGATPILATPKLLMTASPRSGGQEEYLLEGSVVDPERSWSSYLGMGEVTVTRTVTQVVTERIVTPAAVVTFSVRGCHPSHMPFDLPLCSVSNTTSIITEAAARMVSTRDIHYIQE